MHQIVTNQREFFSSQKTKDFNFRLKQLKILERVLKSNEQALYDAIYQDFKKSNFETYTSELALVYHDISDVKRNLKSWGSIKRVGTNFLNFPAKSYIIPEPLGVCLVIGAWNYPYQLSLAPVVAAIAAGNTIILKPSEISNATSNLMANLIRKNFEPHFFAVVEGGVTETTELLKQNFDKIFFTGSTQVGKIVYQAAAKNLTPVTLELGGKSPTFITKNCHLRMTVKRLIWAKFLNAGQTCIAPDYVMVHTSKAQEFLELAKAEILKEQFSFKNDNYVQIINDRNVERLSKMIHPDKVFFGGKIDIKNRYIEPTILHNITFDDAVMQEEIFGPILPVLTYDSLKSAIEQVNALPKPLSCYVFTKNRKDKQKILNQISFGGGAVNDAVMHITNTNLPFGGVGSSGIGNYHGEAGFKCFTHYKSVLDKPTWIELPLKYYPHTKFKLSWIRKIMRF